MGGVETHCEHIYPRIVESARREFSIFIVARAPYVAKKIRRFRKVVVFPSWSLTNPYLEALVHTFTGLLQARFVLRADLVHIHAIGPGLLVPFARLLGLRVVFTHHGEDFRRAKWNWAARLALRFGETLALAFSDRAVVVSRSLARQIAARQPKWADKIVHIPNGATIADATTDGMGRRDVLERFQLQRKGYILTVGRLVPEKGIHDLIDAFERSGSKDKLVIVGAPQTMTPYAERLLARASERVLFTGEMKRNEIDPLYAQARLFVLASYHEGLPIAALEALASGCRVLLSDIPPNRDLDLGITSYFRVGDVADLADRLANPDDVAPADGAAFRKRYDWNAIAGATADIYRLVRDAGRSAGLAPSLEGETNVQDAVKPLPSLPTRSLKP